MIENKRFIIKPSINKTGYVVIDNEKQYTFPVMNEDDCYMFCKVMNTLYEENQQHKALLQDMGLLMSDEDVMCIRTEIAEKFIKPVCNGNGFDVDVDCTNGFTIIPKGDLE